MDPEQVEPGSEQPQELPTVNCASLNVLNTTTISDLHHNTEKLKGEINYDKHQYLQPIISGVTSHIMADLSLIHTHSQAKDFAEMVSVSLH